MATLDQTAGDGSLCAHSCHRPAADDHRVPTRSDGCPQAVRVHWRCLRSACAADLALGHPSAPRPLHAAQSTTTYYTVPVASSIGLLQECFFYHPRIYKYSKWTYYLLSISGYSVQ